MSQNLKMVQNQKLFEANFEPYLDHFFAILEEFSTFFYPLLNGQMRKLIFRTRIGLFKVLWNSEAWGFLDVAVGLEERFLKANSRASKQHLARSQRRCISRLFGFLLREWTDARRPKQQRRGFEYIVFLLRLLYSDDTFDFLHDTGCLWDVHNQDVTYYFSQCQIR